MQIPFLRVAGMTVVSVLFALQPSVAQKDRYMENLKTVLQGNVTVKLDTTLLNIPNPEKIND